MRYQRTLKQVATLEGVGLHSGMNVEVRLIPAPEDTGIVFIRNDADFMNINACLNQVVDTRLSTNLGRNGVEVRTVEHLLSTFSALGIDNVYIEINGIELPVLDGSAGKFTEVILQSSIEIQSKRISCIQIKKPITFEDGYCCMKLLPYEGRKITCCIQYDHPLLQQQELSIDITEENFMNEIAPAKTFGFLKDVEMLRANGLALGGTLENAIVLDDDSIMNENQLSFEDEFVRHKILDIIGDLSLLSLPIYGHIIAERPGHGTNIKLLKEILRHPDSWEIMSELDKKAAWPVLTLMSA